MFDRLGNEAIITALDELITNLGIKEELALDDLVGLLRKGDAEGCVQGIATRLGLPIRIDLSYVPKDFRLGNNRFHSSALAQTDSAGHGIEGIVAQVAVPQHLPMWGTSRLHDYPIKVSVSENCHARSDTFVAIVAHELSHVLLACLWSPHKDSELHADLVPIVLGFRKVVRRGRKKTESVTSCSISTTQTTTYGYLTDLQFELACEHVMGILRGHLSHKKRLLNLVRQVRRRLEKAGRRLAVVRDYFRYLDNHRPKSMLKEHAERVVQLYGGGHIREWEDRITAARNTLHSAEAFVQPLNHYTAAVIEQIRAHTHALRSASNDLDQVSTVILDDQRMLRKYVSIMYRLRRALWSHSCQWK